MTRVIKNYSSNFLLSSGTIIYIDEANKPLTYYIYKKNIASQSSSEKQGIAVALARIDARR